MADSSDHAAAASLENDQRTSIYASGYDKSNCKSFILLAVEDFFRKTCFSYYYHNAALGSGSRASIAAVAFDMIDLITYLAAIDPSGEARSLEWWLQDFVQKNPGLRSLAPAQTPDDIWIYTKGHIYELFCIVAGLRPPLATSDNPFGQYARTKMWHYKLPGPEFLVGAPPIDPESVSDGPIEELDAAFICSGPFRIRFTNVLANNLKLNTVRRELLLYWEDNISGLTDFLGRSSRERTTPGMMDQFRDGHVLGKFPFLLVLSTLIRKVDVCGNCQL